MPAERVLVVIVNYRSVRYLPDLLDDLDGEPDVVEVVIRDNGSPLPEQSAVDALVARHPAARTTTGTNVGFGAGVNAAVAAARSDWTHVWVVNPDVRIRRGALRALLDAGREHDCGVMSPLIVSKDASGADVIWFAGGDVHLREGRASHGGVGRPVETVPQGFRRIGFVTGAAPLVTRAAWDALDGFAERFFLYWEDVDFSLRAADAGIAMGITSRAVVEHDQGGSSGGGVSPTFCYYGQRNRLWILPDWSTRWRTALVSGRRTTFDMLVMPLRGAHRSARAPRAVLASARGLLSGLRGPSRRLGETSSRRQRA